MADLSVSQEYLLCVLAHEKTERQLVWDTTFSTCIIVSGFWESIVHHLFKIDDQGKLIISRDYGYDDPLYLKSIVDTVRDGKPKKLNKWVEDYILGFSSKNTKRYIDDVAESLVSAGCLSKETDKGLFHNTSKLIPSQQCVDGIIQKIRAELLEDGTVSDETIVLAALLLQSNKLKNYFSKFEEQKLKERIKEIKNSPENRLIKDILNDIFTIIIAIAASGAAAH